MSVDLDGNVVFADTDNHLIRAYVPSAKHVIDDLAGSIVDGVPTGGFNGDGHWSTDTQLFEPLGVTATHGPLLVIADTRNARVRQVGPAPPEASQAPEPPEVVVACVAGARWSCERRPATSAETGGVANPGSVSISHEGVEFASGRWLATADGSLAFRITELRPLVPGTYQLVIHYAARASAGRSRSHRRRRWTTTAAHNVDT